MVRGDGTIRVDGELIEIAEQIAKANKISVRQATREIAKLVKPELMSKEKIMKEIKF